MLFFGQRLCFFLYSFFHALFDLFKKKCLGMCIQKMQNIYPNNIRLVAQSGIVSNQRLNSIDCQDLLLEMTTAGYNGAYSNGNTRRSERSEDRRLREVLIPQVYSIQSVPGDGSCFFYTIVMILLGYIEDYRKSEPNDLVLASMKCLRSITAYSIFENPDQLVAKVLGDPDVNKMNTDVNKMKTDDEAVDARALQRDDEFARKYFDFFLEGESLPYADDPEIALVQSLPMFSNTLIVIYETDMGMQIRFACHMKIPNVLDDIVLIRRTGVHNGHYEPIVFNVHGRWQHRLPIRERFNDHFENLFQALSNQCPSVREKLNSM